ncbi:hypothetical protein WL98_27210 [Burkholderia multivorans]|nr:hypothetical protein WL98_27210 [Burkholderia multivorans]
MHSEIYPAMVTAGNGDAVNLVMTTQHEQIANIVRRLDRLIAHLVREAIWVEHMQRIENLFGVERVPQ